jgi:predicted RNase H-like HicB family nuclease
MKRFVVALHRSRGGYSACVTGLPGCWSWGTSQVEAIELAREAIRAWLEEQRFLSGPVLVIVEIAP